MASASEGAAWWATAVVSVAVGWSIVRRLRPKCGLRLITLYGIKLQMPPSWHTFALRVTNVGKEPVVVSGIAVRSRGGGEEHLLASRSLPKRLEPNESIDEPFDLTSGLPRDAEALYAYDSSGEVWKLPKNRLKELLEHQARLPRVAGESGTGGPGSTQDEVS